MVHAQCNNTLLYTTTLYTLTEWHTGTGLVPSSLAPNLKYHGKIWHKFPDCGTRTWIDRGWWLSFPMGLRLVAVNCSRFVGGRLDGCSYFREAVGHNENANAKRANNDIQKASDLQIPWLIWHTVIVPNLLAFPNVACS